MNCCNKENLTVIKEYDPMPKNPDGSTKWFLFRWDDGKRGVRRLTRCRECGALYLVQAYHFNKFSGQKNTLFEDYYPVKDERQAEYLNRTYTGMQLEHRAVPAFQILENEGEY